MCMNPCINEENLHKNEQEVLLNLQLNPWRKNENTQKQQRENKP